ncbi:EexN family lipoprotein [Rhizobium sp. TRM95111]|uniref:EexN family lipoprotein n=1 Tax=Rhizobium alarense TaxID=2846851 RepID=UPI001F3F0E48|nr:EexN family lipoprotein [Rhizobium alarense]MCF3642947.1 EexN family lipoprotein [Rhizobium alarense]
MKRIALVIFILAGVAGCGEKTPVQTVEWYKEHDPERAAMVKKCRENPGKLAASANCINAEKAQGEKDLARRGHLQLDAKDFSKQLREE